MSAEIPLRPTLYVCAPFATRTDAEAAETAAVVLRAVQLGWAPLFAPDLYRHVLDEATGRDAGLSCALSLLRRCDALVIVGRRVTAGMEAELRYWLMRHMPIYLARDLKDAPSEWVYESKRNRFSSVAALARIEGRNGDDAAIEAIRAEIGTSA